MPPLKTHTAALIGAEAEIRPDGAEIALGVLAFPIQNDEDLFES